MNSRPALPASTTQSQERLGLAWSGVAAVVVGLASLGAAIAVLAKSANTDAEARLAPVGVALMLLAVASFGGLFIVQPNHSMVVTVLGRYKGTVRKTGLWWTNPIAARKSLSLRVRTLDNDVLKVNDAAGNPVEIAAVINWQVVDTAKASFDVDDFEQFVETQAEAAVRHVASQYPYDCYDEDGFSLRAHADEVAEAMRAELQIRVEVAGIAVLAARLRRLAYAMEIAPEMLRRQQAAAVVAARRLIVDGAVGMVEHALERLSERQIVELDEERKAAMVSNLLVVLCSEKGAQPVVNAGTLYQ